MSAIGTWQTSSVAPHMSAFGAKADMSFALQMSALTQSGRIRWSDPSFDPKSIMRKANKF
jgi:hypothetical protein